MFESFVVPLSFTHAGDELHIVIIVISSHKCICTLQLTAITKRIVIKLGTELIRAHSYFMSFDY